VGRVRVSHAAQVYGLLMIRGLVILFAIFMIATFPATWLLMLFLGNIGTHVSYWGALPLGILVSFLLGTAGSQYDFR
jgi:hypothetical protein